jgi:large subunit ribosomal protein L24
MAQATKKFKLRKGDMVIVNSGREKGKKGKILKILADKEAVLIEKVNLVKRHSRPSQKNPQGGIIEKEAPIHISNVQFLSAKANKGVRVGFKVDGKEKYRVDPAGNKLD